MSTYSVTSNDTLTLNGHVFNDLATDDVSAVTFANELINRKTGKNGNTLFAQSATGLNADLMIKLISGSTDDQFMQNIINTVPQDFPSTKLLTGTFVKRVGDGQGNVVSITWNLQGGVISKIPDGKENVSGDVAQAETVYVVKFASGQRAIG